MYLAFCADANNDRDDPDFDPTEGSCRDFQYHEAVVDRFVDVNAEYEFEIHRSPDDDDKWNVVFRTSDSSIIAEFVFPNTETADAIDFGLETSVAPFVTPSVSSTHIESPKVETEKDQAIKIGMMFLVM